MSNPWSQFSCAVIGKPMHFARREADWVFGFGDNLLICVEAAWRIRDANSILLTNTDDGHQFGLPAPIDAAKRANEILTEATVRSFEYNASTADLKFHLFGDLLVEVLTNSSGYESWQAYKGHDLLGVGGNGGLR